MPPKKKPKVAAVSGSSVQWEYKDDSGVWQAYGTEDNSLLEKAFNGSSARSKILVTTELSFNKGYDTKYTFDFKKMTQTNEDSHKVRNIRRVGGDDSTSTSTSSSSSDDIQWEWKDDSGIFVPFYDEDVALIEKEYQKDNSGSFKTIDLSFNADFKTPYIFDFSKMIQHNTESLKDRIIRRVPKAGAWNITDYGTKSAPAATTTTSTASPSAGPSLALNPFPDYWTPKNLEVDLIDVNLSSPEAIAILKNFHKTINRKVTVHSLTRIQNYSLYPFYCLTRQHIADRNKGNAHELTLFHGARVRQNMDAIINFGFDMRVAATGLYGIGIYFAVNAKYSDNGYVLQNPDKSKEMFICRVACGSWTPGNSALRRPPPKNAKNPTGDLYDSVVNTGKEIIMHIVFNNAQAYPEYIVKYT